MANSDDPGTHNYVTGCFAGGLVCRGILEQFSEPKVKTFISLSSPQAGQFGGELKGLLERGRGRRGGMLGALLSVSVLLRLSTSLIYTSYQLGVIVLHFLHFCAASALILSCVQHLHHTKFYNFSLLAFGSYWKLCTIDIPCKLHVVIFAQQQFGLTCSNTSLVPSCPRLFFFAKKLGQLGMRLQ